MSKIEVRGWSLHQPWASLVACGLKRVETRGKGHPYRGLVAIHASKPWSQESRDALDRIERQFPVEVDARWSRLSRLEARPPLGGFVAVARLTACEVMTEASIAAQTPLERACGDWRAGRYAYRLENVQPLEAPVPASGKQGLWRLDPYLPELRAVRVAAESIMTLSGLVDS